MVADSALLIEQLAANAWPAATVQLVDGWLLRYTPGVARRRSNSALPSPGATCASPAQRAQVLDLTERFYARRRQPTAVQVSPAELHDQLDGELAARGYRRQAPTLVLTAPIHRVPVRAPTTSAVAVSIADAVTAQWLAAWTAIEARPDAAATNQQILARIGPQAGYLTAIHDRDVVGVGMVVVERGWAGVFCMATDPPTAVAGWPTPCSSTRPVGLPIKESTSSTFRSRRTTSPPCGSTAGSASSRPTAITTAWRRPDRPRFRRRITKRRERSRPGSRPRWSSPRL
jgi:N-acetylglutamate synthase